MREGRWRGRGKVSERGEKVRGEGEGRGKR